MQSSVQVTNRPAGRAGQVASRLRSGWLLWADWCEAFGRSPLEVTADRLAAYVAAVKRPSIDDVAATVREVGLPWPGEDVPPDPRAAFEDALVPLPVALGRCETRGWPTGYRGRRDAWLLVLTRGLRLTRREALAVRAEDVPGLYELMGARVPAGQSSASCWRCVACRWVEVVNLADTWSWRTVCEHLRRPAPLPGTGLGADGHVCGDGLAGLGGVNAFLDESALAPAIDRHGGGTPGRTMSARALTAVIATRSARSWTPQAIDVPERPDLEFADVDDEAARAFDASTLDRLEAAMDAADEVNDRISALLADTEAMLARMP